MITAFTGFPGGGKTTMLARQLLLSLDKARKLYDMGIPRTVHTNIELSPELTQKYGHLVINFRSLNEMPHWHDTDIFIDELAIYFNSRKWESMSDEMMAFINLHRHQRVNIYGAVQDFLTVDSNFRRKTQYLYLIRKLLSTREPNPYDKPQKMPFSWVSRHLVSKEHYDLEKHHYSKFEHTDLMLFTKKDFAVFNTHEIFKKPEKFLTKEVIHCPEDGYKKTFYHIQT